MLANFLTALNLGGHSRAAYERLKIFAGWYSSLLITDSTFPYLRGMPFLETFVAQSAPILRRIADDADADVNVESWYRSLFASLDEGGQAVLQAGRASWGLR